MFNVHQFANRRQQLDAEAKKQLELQQYHLRHEEYKANAHHNLSKKTEDFLTRELTSANPTVIEDDHFQSWRKQRVFRDIEAQNKFMGSKVFKHRPNEDMGKHYEERERRERSYLASKTDQLVKNGLIPQEQAARSLASQGPYNPKIQFREFRKEEEYTQPRMRYSNITDEQKLNESDMQFDERLQSIYQKFQQKKLRAGKPIKYASELPSEPSYAESAMNTTKSVSIRKSRAIVQPEEAESLSVSSSLAGGKQKTYFKLAQMMEMFHPEAEKRERLGSLLEQSQFNRRKDLSNIRSNSYNENYAKRPL